MRPKSCGSSTIGMKKSVVAMMQVLSSSCQTAASSAVSVPTSSCLKGAAAGWSASSCCSTEGASLQPQPPPCARLVSLTLRDVHGVDLLSTALAIAWRARTCRQARASSDAALLDVRAGRRAAKRQAHGAQRLVAGDAERGQDRGGLLAVGVTGRAGRRQHARAGLQHAAARHAGEQHVERIGQPLRGDRRPARGRVCRAAEAPAALPTARPCARASDSSTRAADAQRGAEPDDEGDVLGARPEAVLLACADDQRRQRHAACGRTARRCPWARRACGRRWSAGRRRARFTFDRDLADRLRGIGMHQRAAAPWLQRAISATGWMVPISFWAWMTVTSAVSIVDRCRHALGRDDAVAFRRHAPDRMACALQQLAAGVRRRMLDIAW